jgi:ABC-type nitrate/sulfonate/bicarbonate transport system permease component
METLKINRSYRRLIVYALVVLLLAILWEYASENNNKVRLLLSSPSLVLKYFNENSGLLITATLTTFFESISGLIIATIFALCTMIFCLYYPKLLDYLLPVMISSQVIPLITLAPLFVIIFDYRITAIIMMASLLCYFPIFINFSTGIKLIPSQIIDLMNIYNATKTQKIIKVYFPLSLPHIMAGLRVSATLAVIGSIVAEFTGAKVGLGRNLYISAIRLEPDLMMTSLFLSAILGFTLFLLIVMLERIFGNWYIKKEE